MRLLLTGRQIEITPALRKLVDARLLKLERMLGDGIVSVQLVLAREKYRYIAELTVHARGDHMLHGLGSTSSWSTSLTAAVEKVMQQALKLKGKWQERHRRGAGAKLMGGPPAGREPASASSNGPEAASSGRGSAQRLVRSRSYSVKPMTVEEAVLEVEGAENEVLVFRNASTDAINVIYRRRNGGLGLIEPEI
jgi:putative sigma-54 modulation protein